VLPYRDTELRSPVGRLTFASPSGPRTARRSGCTATPAENDRAVISPANPADKDRALVTSAAPADAAEFGSFGIDVDRLERRTRPLLRPCLDWSERRYHLAGSLGAALTSSLLERRWITTREASRIVTVTETGRAGLREWLGVDVAELRAAA
jgi:hypothetical protein